MIIPIDQINTECGYGMTAGDSLEHRATAPGFR